MSYPKYLFIVALVLFIGPLHANEEAGDINDKLERIEKVMEKLIDSTEPKAPESEGASEPVVETPAADPGLRKDLDSLFVLICAALVFLMQAGFCMLELGFVRAKNCLNVVMKNVADFCISVAAFLLLGFSLMFGSSLAGWVGGEVAWLASFPKDSPIWMFWFFQAVFAATATTIVSGAMAERTKFNGYLAYTVMISAFIYPVLGHWAWGSFAGGLAPGFGGDNGWLQELGFSDFAGSTVVHGIGGACALAGIIVVGPRKGRFNSDGTPRLIAGHNIPMAALGTLLLGFGWFGFNCGSNLVVDGSVGRIAVNTLVAASSGGLLSILAFWFRDGRPDPGRLFNGILGGLVAVTACCNVVSPISALILGAIAGIISSVAEDILLRFKLDDVVGAVPVHLFNGIWGTLCVAIFNEGGFNIKSLGIQALGALSICGTAFVVSYLGFLAFRSFGALRATDEEQEDGLDFSEHSANAYPDFTTD